jgi:hypothetical protein
MWELNVLSACCIVHRVYNSEKNSIRETDINVLSTEHYALSTMNFKLESINSTMF